jgi:hypothetical protein
MSDSGASFSDGISGNIDLLAEAVHPRAVAVMEEGADELVAYAQANAPWGDRTGEARAGLDAEVYEEGDEIVVDLFHTAEHGVWLEIAMGGVYAIIMPTLEALGPDILRRAGASSLSMEGEE